MYLRIQSSWGTEPGYGLQTIYDKDLDIAPATIMPCIFKCLRKKTRTFKLYQLQFELPN